MEYALPFFYILLAFIIGVIGADRKIGFWKAFLLSLFLSPFLGAIFTLHTKLLSTEKFEEETLATLEQQQKTIELLKKESMHFDDVSSSSPQTIQVPLEAKDGYKDLAKEEKGLVDKLNPKLKNNEVIVKHQGNKKISIISKSSYKSWNKQYKDIITLLAEK